MKEIIKFVGKFNSDITLDETMVVKKKTRYYLLGKKLKPLVSNDFFFAGTYLGEIRKELFFPSFDLLNMIADRAANKIWVDEKTEWLFICGRDIFKQGITQISGSRKRGDYTLVLNDHGECLGFGKIINAIEKGKDEETIVIKNLFDIGDFLRRER